jgi:cytoskeletal protein CcmA (bactofilin family)
MARKTHDDAFGAAGAETMIGAGVTVHGNLISESDVTIDGQLEGDVTATGDVTVGVNARVKGNVHGTNVTVLGHLKGNIVASGEASIRETGQVEGDITSAGIAINSGGIFVGRSKMQTIPSLDIPSDSPLAEVETKPKSKSKS